MYGKLRLFPAQLFASLKQGSGTRYVCARSKLSISDHLHTTPVQLPSETEIAVRILKKMGIVFQKDCPDHRRNLPLKIMTRMG